jgi:hypothetical protein
MTSTRLLMVVSLGLAACHTSSEDLFVRNTGPESNIRLGGDPSEYLWGHAYGSAVSDYPSLVLALSDGGAILAGEFGGGQAGAITDPTAPDGGVTDAGPVAPTVNLGGGDLPVATGITGFIARYDATGATVWSVTWPGNGSSEVATLALTADGGVVVTGSVMGSIDLGGGILTVPPDNSWMFVLKLDGNGHFQWARVLGDRVNGSAVTVDAEGNIYALGSFAAGTTTFDGIELSSTSSHSVVMVALDPQGTTRWARLVTAADDGSIVTDAGPPGPGAGSINADSVVSDAHGIVLAGSVFGIVDIGTGTLPTFGREDAYVMAFGKDGTPQWARRFGGTGSDGIASIALLADGGLAIAGTIIGSATLDGFTLVGTDNSTPFMAVLEREGHATRWAQALDISIRELSVSTQGELVGVGYASRLTDTSAFGAFVGVFAPADGTITRARAFPGNNMMASGGLDGEGGVMIAGSYYQSEGHTIDLGAGFLPKFGASDLFVAKLHF